MIQDVRRASELILNAPYRLEVCAAVHRVGKESFTTREVAAQLRFPMPNDNVVGRNLKKLAETDLLETVDELWKRRTSVFWRCCDEWYQELVDRNGVPALARPPLE